MSLLLVMSTIECDDKRTSYSRRTDGTPCRPPTQHSHVRHCTLCTNAKSAATSTSTTTYTSYDGQQQVARLRLLKFPTTSLTSTNGFLQACSSTQNVQFGMHIFGCAFLELLYTQNAFSVEALPQIMQGNLRHSPRPPRRPLPRAPPLLSAFVYLFPVLRLPSLCSSE